MISVYCKSSNHWKKEEFFESFFVVDDYLQRELSEEVFSFDDNFFSISDSSYWQFLQRLTSNSNRRNSFCSTFSALWKDFPTHNVLRLLLVKKFSEPSMIKTLGMEQFGFEEPTEDFEQILDGFRASARKGMVTSIKKSPIFDGRVHLDFGHLHQILDDTFGKEAKTKLFNFEDELLEIESSKLQLSTEHDYIQLLSISFYHFFGEFERSPEENYSIVAGSLQMNREFAQKLSTSVELCLTKFSEEEIFEYFENTCQIPVKRENVQKWLTLFLDFTVSFKEATFDQLYTH